MALAAPDLEAASLCAGDEIYYYSPCMGFGDLRGLRSAVIIGIDPDAEYPLALDTSELVARTTMIKLTASSSTSTPPNRSWSLWRKLRTYTLCPGRVDRQTRAQKLTMSLSTIVADSFASTRHHRVKEAPTAPLIKVDKAMNAVRSLKTSKLKDHVKSTTKSMKATLSSKPSARVRLPKETTAKSTTPFTRTVNQRDDMMGTTLTPVAPKEKLSTRRIPGRPPGTYQYVPGGREYQYLDDSDAYSSYDEMVWDYDDGIVPESDYESADHQESEDPPPAARSVAETTDDSSSWWERLDKPLPRDEWWQSKPLPLLSQASSSNSSWDWVVSMSQSNCSTSLLHVDSLLVEPSQSSVKLIMVNRNEEGIRFPSMDIGMCTCESACDSACLNALARVWCTDANCRARSCYNRLLQSTAVQLVETSTGLGVQAVAFIGSDEVVGEYLGELTTATTRAASSRYAFQIRKRSTAKRVVYIDASSYGGLMRYVNHSCAPNCTFIQYEHLADVRVAVVTSRELAPGEELTVTYNIGDLKFECRCGEKTCVSQSALNI